MKKRRIMLSLLVISILMISSVSLVSAESNEPAEPETCAAEIVITFDKEVYYVGDYIHLTQVILDSEGNPIPNYQFYVIGYDYINDRWNTTSESHRVGSDGYTRPRFKLEGDDPSFGFGKFKAKVYTKQIGSCDYVETTFEREVRKKEPVPCGIGTCIPEEEAEEVEVIPEDKVFYKCNGCELGDKCYPMGYRKEGQYCSENYEFIEQLRAGVCDNSFECESNVCISGECVGEGFIKKIIAWFKKLFGDEEEEEPGLEMCSRLLIEKNIGENIYIETAYGLNKDMQAPLFSDQGEKIGTIKCCHAQHKDSTDQEHGALICPYNNRKDVENLIKFLGSDASPDEPGGPYNSSDLLGEYKGETVLIDEDYIFLIWTHDTYALVVGGDERKRIPFPEDMADAYLNKYPSDLGELPYEHSLEDCEEITDSDARDECYENIAIQINESSLCERIINLNLRGRCIWTVAQETNDANLCEILPEMFSKGSCYYEIAIKTKDVSLCEKITDELSIRLKYMCYSVLTNNVNMCEELLSDFNKDACYSNFALETRDDSICENIVDSEHKDYCYSNIALETKDATFCEKINYSSIKEDCYRIAA